jgi:hypothetical protein
VHFVADMAAYSEVSQNKRGRDEYWNGGLAFPEAKRTNTGLTLAHDSDLMAFLDKIDYMDNKNSNPEDTDAVNKAEGKQLDEKGSSHQTGSIKEVELIDRNSEVISLVCDTGDFAYYDDVGAELGFFVDDITPHELGIIMNHCPCYVDGDSMHDILYSDAVYGYAETNEVFGSLWEDDIWQLNEHPVTQNDFASPQQKEIGINGDEFHDVCKDVRPIQR